MDRGQSEDRHLRDELIQMNLGLVRALAAQIRERHCPTVDFDELVAYGSRGLVEAARRWDPERGVTFPTFAYYRIRGAIYDGLREQGWLKRQRGLRAAAGANEYLRQRADEAPARRGLNAGARNHVVELAGTLNDLAVVFVVSMSSVSHGEIPDETSISGFEQVARGERRKALLEAVQGLPDKERQIIRLCYFEDLPLKAAGERLGLSKSWVSRLHTRAIRLLAEQLGHLKEEKKLKEKEAGT